jgi:hypothetical protein
MSIHVLGHQERMLEDLSRIGMFWSLLNGCCTTSIAYQVGNGIVNVNNPMEYLMNS